MSDSKDSKKKTGGWKAFVLSFKPFIIIGIIGGILLLRACSTTRDHSVSVTTAAASQASPVTAWGPAGFRNLPMPPAQVAPQAKPMAINDVCSPFALTVQMCTTDVDNSTGWVGLDPGVPQKPQLCVSFNADTPDTPPDKRLIKSWAYLLDDGSILDYQLGQPRPMGIKATKIVFTHAMIFSYWAAINVC